MESIEERIANLESLAIAVLHVALIGAVDALRGDLHKTLRTLAANEDLPPGARDMLAQIANHVEGEDGL